MLVAVRKSANPSSTQKLYKLPYKAIYKPQEPLRHFVNFLLLCLTAWLFCGLQSLPSNSRAESLQGTRSLYHFTAENRLAYFVVVVSFFFASQSKSREKAHFCQTKSPLNEDKPRQVGSLSYTILEIVLKLCSFCVIILVNNSVGKITIIIEQHNRF